VYSFKILPPWWRTWWVYWLYIIAGGAAVFGLVRIRTRQLEARHRELEKTVEERTQEIQQRVEELAVINSVQEGLVKELNMQAIYDLVGDKIRDIFDAQVVLIGTFDHEAEMETQKYTIEKGQRFYPEPRLLGQIRRRLITTGELVLINENFLEALADLGNPQPQPVPGTVMPKSVLFMPLVVGQTVKGYVSLQNVDREHAFKDSDVRLLTTLANSMSVALENARLFDETTRLLKETETGKKNVELLSEIGKDITASLDIDTIFYKLYEHVNQLADASSFGVGIYHPEKQQIEYRLAIEKGKRYAPYTRDTRDKNQFPVWCIENRRPVFMNEVTKEHSRYINEFKSANVEGMVLEDGTLPEEPFSIIYLPLISQDKVLGVITIQSFQENAYTDYHLNLLQNLAAYTAIALDNADAYRQVDASVQQLNATLENLKATQQQLVTQQKLASLGQLTAGIAHEIKNPLNFVNNFAMLSVDLAKELREEIEKRRAKSEGRDDFADIEEILDTLVQNAEKINHHGKRADGIVKSMMQHARGSSGQREQVDINHLLDEAVNLVYHGMRANDPSFNVTIEKEYDESIDKLEVVPQGMSRVFLNIISNACYAAFQKQKANGKEQTANNHFSPTLSVSTKNLGDTIEIRIRDNGNGIPIDIREKIFNPFFTTKPTGQGTGLGLSISHDIIEQEHKGEIKVETEEGKFTEFVVRLPRA